MRDADVVFSGEVRSIDEEESIWSGPLAATGRITFAVEDSWKDVTAQTVDVHGQGDGVNCYNVFEKGEAYLVYASRVTGDDASLENIGCGETKPLAAAEADLQRLGPPVGTLPATGGVAPLAAGGVLLAIAALLVCTSRVVGVPNKRTRP